jgi:hypothetical protein
MQENLVFKIADALQVQTGFRYVPSRSAFVDSVRTLLVDDIQRFLTYGEGLELALSGAYDDADRVLSDANLSIARRDQSVIEQMRLEIQQGRIFQNPLSLREATRQSEIQLEAALNELTQSTLGTFGVNLDMTGSLPLSGSPVNSNGQPPNDTIPGSQDPSQLPIQVVRVILPPPPVND